jgi:hypothetical protein
MCWNPLLCDVITGLIKSVAFATIIAQWLSVSCPEDPTRGPLHHQRRGEVNFLGHRRTQFTAIFYFTGDALMPVISVRDLRV